MKLSISADLITFDGSMFSAAEIAKICKEEMTNTVARITSTTAQGVDPDGQSYKPYSPGYAEKKQKAGRGTTPDLTWSHEMLGSRQILDVPGGVEARFVGGHKSGTSNAELAAINIDRGRDFHAFGEPDSARIDTRLNAETDRRLAQGIKVQKGR